MIRSLFVASTLLVAAPAAAQQLELPVLSPRASVSQQIGTVTVTVDYSSPAVRDRTIWGELVPLGELWRTGANAATTFETTGDLTVGGQEVPAGRYALFTIPGEDSWTVILNTNPDQGGTGGYDEALDQARFTVTPTEGPDRERLTFLFSDTVDDGATLQLEWAGVRVPMAIEVDTEARVRRSIEAYVDRVPRSLADAGRYLGTHGDVEAGLALVDDSLALQETWFATWVKAEILHESGDDRGAYKAAKQAMRLGKAADGGFFYEGRIAEALDTWPRK